MQSPGRRERYELIVIGGGQAGLAAGYWLSQQDIDFIILDDQARTGDNWRHRWDSLRLFTPAKYSSLPGMAFPAAPYHLPTRDEMADYLEWYASAFDLPVRYGTRVQRLRKQDGLFELATTQGIFEAHSVIVATGAFQVPRIPSFGHGIATGITQIHSSAYKSAATLPQGNVLVVGAGNSGAQIALELSRDRKVILAGRSVGALPRRVLGRDIFDWLWPTVMRPGSDSFLGRRIRRNVLSSSDALIGMTEEQLRAAGVSRGGRVVDVVAGTPVLADLGEVKVDSIVWSTGYSPDFSWIDAPVLDDRGYPEHARGVTTVPGLYFLGLRFLHRLNSSLVGGVGEDARYVVRAIAARYGHTRDLRSPVHFSGRPARAYT